MVSKHNAPTDGKNRLRNTSGHRKEQPPQTVDKARPICLTLIPQYFSAPLAISSLWGLTCGYIPFKTNIFIFRSWNIFSHWIQKFCDYYCIPLLIIQSSLKTMTTYRLQTPHTKCQSSTYMHLSCTFMQLL